MKFREKNAHQGFTLLELLIVLAISSVVATAVYKTYRSQQQASIIVSELAGADQNLRAASLVVHRDARMAGYGLKDFLALPAFRVGAITNIDTDGDGNADDTINTNNDSNYAGADAIFIRFLQSTGIEIAKYQGAASNMRVCAPCGFNVGDILFVITADEENYRTLEVTLVGQVGETLCTGDADKINFSPGLSNMNYPGGLGADYTGGTAYKIVERCYFIRPDGDGDGVQDDPCLMFADNYADPVVFAENIEDLQAVYIMADDSETTSPSTISDIRSLRITVLARTDRDFPGFSSTRPAIEDHSAAASSDGFRRRQLSSLSVVRNLNL